MDGIKDIWNAVLEHRQKLTQTGELDLKRRKQSLEWMRFLLDEGLKSWFFQLPAIKTELPNLSWSVEKGKMTSTVAAAKLLDELKLLGSENKLS
jgi:LAO/AO transport system kinase